MAAESTETDSAVRRRKDHHIDICLEQDVTGGGLASGLGGYVLEYDALPELDLEAVSLETSVLGKSLSAPLVIGAMTGGTERAGELNRRLARGAARVGVGLALGSQRAMLVDPTLTSTFVVKDAAPDLPLLFSNVGAVQLNYGVGVKQLKSLVEAVDADALNVHLNALQEAVQPEGDTRFSGLAAKLREVIDALEVPVFAKEVGAGIGPRAASKLAALPLAGVEVAGVGGTSWAKVESFRGQAESHQANAGRNLAGFGVPTADSLRFCRAAFGAERVVVASGGVRTGLDVAVALALGADVVALAKPLLEAANESEDAVVRALETLIYELRVVLFCCGAANVKAMREVRILRPGQPWASVEAGVEV